MTKTLTKNIAAATVAMAVALSSLVPSFAAGGSLTNEQLANATYPIPDSPAGAVQLKDGKFIDPTNHFSVDLVPPQDKGDLNGDSAEDAAVHLAVGTGASGVFSYLAAVLNDNGAAKPLPAVFLGDRVAVRSIRIARNGEIVVLLLERRFDQPMSARPTIPVVRRFKVAGDRLIASSPLSAVELMNATYPLEYKGGQVTFQRGQFEDRDAQFKATLAPSPRANGDLNGDVSPDAAVSIIVNSGTSGVLTFVSAVLNNGGIAQPADVLLIGDRVKLSSLAIEGGVLTVNYLDRKPDESMSARPTVPMTKQFALLNGKLVDASMTAQPMPVQPAPVPPTTIQQVDFSCADSVAFTVVFAGEVATVTLNGQTQELKQQPSGSGFIYANENWQLQGKGEDATLTNVKTKAIVAKDCKGKVFQPIMPLPAPAPVSPAPIQQVDYICANNVTFTAVYAGEVATLFINGQAQELKQQSSGSGVIYANANWELRGKGDDAMLTDLKTNTVVAKDCKAKPFQPIVPLPAPAAAPLPDGKLTGEVYYLQFIALPDDAVVTVRLRQVLPDVAPAIASQTIETKGKQQPFPFELTYDPAKIDPEGIYIVEAVITEKGKVRWAQVEQNYVLTNGAPADDVRVRVSQVASVGQKDSQPAAAADVVIALSSDPRFSTLVKLVSDAGLVEALTGLKNSTIFAPTNDAFAALPAGAMDELQGNMSMLIGILSYHVSPEKMDAKTLAGKTEVPTLLQDLTIRVKSEGGKVLLNDSTDVVQADIPAGSNLIHAVSGVLTPFETFGMAGPEETLVKAEFVCADDETMSVVFDNGNRTAAVTFAGQTVILPQQESGSGIRYADEQFELRGKGEDVTLTDVTTGNVVLADCKQQKPAETTTTMSETAPALSGILTGTVSYLQRIAVSPDAVIEVTLADVSKMDVAATIISTQIFTAAGKQQPFAFELSYNPVDINPRMTYAVQARITEGGQLRFINTSMNAVLTRGAPVTNVDILVEQVSATAPTTPTAPVTPTAPALSGVLTGTVSYLQRMALPPNATISVVLVDVSKADAPSTVLAQSDIPTNGKQVPIAFELNYDPASIQPQNSYAVQARILVDGKLRFISTQRYPALTRGAPATGINVIVQPVQ